MQGTKSAIDWQQVQRERHEGAKVKDLAIKYGVSDVSIYMHTRGNGFVKAPRKRAAANGNGKPKESASLANPGASPGIGAGTIAGPIYSLPENPRSATLVEKEFAGEVADTMQKSLTILRAMGYEIMKRPTGQVPA